MSRFDRTIPPGGEGKITLKLKTKGYQGKLIRGAKIYSNDPSRKPQMVKIGLFIKAAIRLSPRYVSLKGFVGEPVSKTIQLDAGLDKPLTIEPGTFTLDDKVKYEIEEVEKGKTFRIRFTSTPGRRQDYSGVLKLKTNYPESPVLEVAVYGKFRTQPPIRFSPANIHFKGAPGDTITKTIRVRAGRKRALTLQPFSFDLEKRVKYRIEEVVAGKNFLIHFTNIPGYSENYIGHLKLKTGYPERPQISILIRGHFKD